MTDRFAQTKEKLLSTEYPRWRNLLSCTVLTLLSTGAVSAWWWAYYTTPDVGCHRGILYFSVVWLVAQWIVIGYLYWYQYIPAFARDGIKLLILVANVWFGLFIFSLQPCGQ
ncbi:MAG: hypothetical protein R3276_04810 [Marinobacter sp.]|nr:hypothetical protein [Marinobacter sp.]